jgi:ribose transport system substrate-binding protein
VKHRIASKLAATAVLGLAVGGVVSGCGSSSTTGTASSAASSASAATSNQSGQLQAQIAELEVRPTKIGITQPIQGGMPKGKKIVFLQCAVPACVQIGDSMQTATQSLGWQLSRINLGTSPTSVIAAWQEALRQNPDGIALTGGYPESYYRAQLAQAAARKIPIIGFSQQHAGAPFNLVIGSGDVQGAQAGNMAALFVASKIDSGTTLAVNIPGVGSVVSELAAYKADLPKYCPKCTVDTIDLPPASIGSTAATKIANYVVGHPNVKFVFMTTIDFALGLPAAIASAGIAPVPSVSATESNEGLDLIQKKQGGLEATAFWVNIEGAYRAIDAFGRIFKGQSIAQDQDATLPKWLVTSANVTGERPLPAVQDYRQQFDSLWGVQ